jgi:hypothetical protein
LRESSEGYGEKMAQRTRLPAPLRKTAEGSKAFASYFNPSRRVKINKKTLRVRVPKVNEEIILVRNLPRPRKKQIFFYRETARQSTKTWNDFLNKFIKDTQV